LSKTNPPSAQYFDKERLYDYVKKYSFPRLCGTEGEEKAVNLTYQEFKDIGYKESQIEKEPFKFSDFYSTTLINLVGVICLLSTLIMRLFAYIYFFFTIIVILFMLVFLLLIMRGLKHPEIPGFWGEYFGTSLPATNIIVKLPAKSLPENEAANIVISAHIDSKSQTFKTSWRIVLYRVWLYSGIVLGGFYFTIILDIVGFFDLLSIELSFVVADVSYWILIILISVSNAFLMMLGTHNKSPGALDNASGMAVIFELSSHFKDKPLDNFNLWFCQFSAEELGTMGSRIFCNNRDDIFEKGRIFQINFDMISSATHGPKRNRVEYLKSYGVLPRKKIAPVLSDYLDRSANLENVRIYGFHLATGAHLDSVPFHLRGFDAVDLSTRAGAKWAHNKIDTPDKVDPEVLVEACIIARKTILLLDEDYETLCAEKKMECEEE